MTAKLFITFILIQTFCLGQNDTSSERKYYKHGGLKLIAINRGIDTIEFKSYYKNGQLKDSVWLSIQKRDEVLLGTEKTFYENGSISSITHYKKGRDEFISYHYWRNGKLSRFEQRPTGLTKLYNKKGEQIREYDNHKLNNIYVSREFRKQRHLIKSGFIFRVDTKKATLLQDGKKHKLCSGALISLMTQSDSIPLTHCQIEGFSKDSIYLSKFHYNENYPVDPDLTILKFDSAFAFGFNQLHKIYYAKHKDRKRLLGALTAMTAGVELVILPIIAIAFIAPSTDNPASLAYVYGGFAAIGIPLIYYGQYLFKTMVPKKYDLTKSRILVMN